MTNHDSNIVAFPGAAPANELGRLLIPKRLTEARLAARLTQTELAQRAGVTRQMISYYELGKNNPTPEVMRKISQELQQPISFFTKASRPTFGAHSAKFFRKIGADTQRRNKACEVLSEWFSSAAFAFDSVANYPRVDLPQFEPQGDHYSEEEIEECADATREHFGLGLGPISNVLRLLESKGVLICRYTIPGENIDAFSYWSGEKPFIFLASEKNSAARARFDASHELGHLCLHRCIGKEDIENKNQLKVIEKEADRFAGAFLLPAKSFPNEVYSPRAENFLDLKARWKVSIQGMVYRCKDLDLFDERQIINIYKQISYKKWKTVEPLDKGANALSFEEPLLLKRVAELVFESGRYQVDEFRADLALSDVVLQSLTGVSFAWVENDEVGDFRPTLK